MFFSSCLAPLLFFNLPPTKGYGAKLHSFDQAKMRIKVEKKLPLDLSVVTTRVSILMAAAVT